jgi:hypothetical protein
VRHRAVHLHEALNQGQLDAEAAVGAVTFGRKRPVNPEKDKKP